MPLILGTNSIKDTGYDVANSLRFNSGSSDYLNRTPSSASNRKTFTISFWTKICKFDTAGYTIIGAGNSSSGEDGELVLKIDNFGTDGQLILQTGPSTIFETTQALRDVSAWYHIVISVDTTNGTSGNRVRLYINGSEVSDFDVENQPSQNQDFAMNSNVVHEIGRFPRITDQEFDGYLAEFVLIDGQQLAPDQFGEFDEDSGIWKPKAVSGLTFGTNGFYLDFENSGSLGADVSGNGNNFTVNNLTSIDQSTDTCTNNFATMNSLANSNSNVVLSQGNLFVSTQTSWLSTNSTLGVSSGKWYAEIKLITLGSVRFGIGKVGTTATATNTISQTNNQASKSADGYEINHSDGNKVNNNSSSSYGSAFSVNDIGMIAFDCDNGTIWIGKNGTWFNSATQSEIENGTTTNAMYSSITIDNFFLFTNSAETTGGGSVNGETSWNFGSPSYTISSGNSDGNSIGNFEYAVPSGYYALNTKNLAEYG